MSNKFQELQDRIVGWRNTNLPESTLTGTLKHLLEEVKDLQKNPYDPDSLADVFILMMAVCDEVGYTLDDVAIAIEAKQAINESRHWGKADSEGIIRHIKETKF